MHEGPRMEMTSLFFCPPKKQPVVLLGDDKSTDLLFLCVFYVSFPFIL